MKTGQRLVVGHVGGMWSGTASDNMPDNFVLTTVWENISHGANMQCSVVFWHLLLTRFFIF